MPADTSRRLLLRRTVLRGILLTRRASLWKIPLPCMCILPCKSHKTRTCLYNEITCCAQSFLNIYTLSLLHAAWKRGFTFCEWLYFARFFAPVKGNCLLTAADKATDSSRNCSEIRFSATHAAGCKTREPVARYYGRVRDRTSKPEEDQFCLVEPPNLYGS